MVKKLQKSADDKLAAAATGLLDSQLAQTVKDSAQQIWLAGLGAFAKAQGSGKVFETLMKEGVHLQRQTQAAAGEKLGDVAGKMSAMAGEVGHKANAQWDKLETIFEERTARALGRLGVPSAKELAALAARVDTLAAALARLTAASADAAPAVRRKSAKGLAPAPAPAAAPAAARRKPAASKPAAAPAETARAAKPAKAAKAPAVRMAAAPRKRAT